MKLELPLLGLLAMRRMSGYEIKKWLDSEGQFLGLDRHPSQIYRELNRMQVDGLIEFDVENARGGGPDAKVYRLTAAGGGRLRRWAGSAYDPPKRFQAPEFTCRLLFTSMLDAPRALALVKQELEFRVRQVARNRGRDRGIPGGLEPGVDAARLRFVGEELHRHGMAAVDGWIDWLRRMEAAMEADGWQDAS
ncbi:PadR family transcriptional regulator [Actinomadura violacea]|uniref:PadR family transcriptional regulator n=1 Tax=Actinomadura violacea TaxID=2819934 RepID=A0ABS3RV90_9ACTN|nr:PadR family transcriptional regulator [Actinomadura violacea]MBO2459940.1 PadR family transcriptional regulator [Actinomadura violacea]